MAASRQYTRSSSFRTKTSNKIKHPSRVLFLFREQFRVEGSSFSSFCTSLSSVCVFLMFLLTPSRVFDSLVVSPPISTVMSLILHAVHLLREDIKKQPRRTAQCIFSKCDKPVTVCQALFKRFSTYKFSTQGHDK